MVMATGPAFSWRALQKRASSPHALLLTRQGAAFPLCLCDYRHDADRQLIRVWHVRANKRHACLLQPEEEERVTRKPVKFCNDKLCLGPLRSGECGHELRPVSLLAALDEGIILHAGLSEVSVEDIEAAAKVFDVATVQNRYNLVDRQSENVLDYCERHSIGFIPWFPLGAGSLARSGSRLDTIARRHGAAPSQIALAWVLKRSPVMLPIPGTSKVAHLEENVAAADVVLSDEEFAALDYEGRRA